MHRQIHIPSKTNKEERWEWMETRHVPEENSRKILVENDEIVWEKDPEVLEWYGGRGHTFYLLFHQVVAGGLD